MRAVITYSSDWHYEKVRIEEINTLEELLNLQEKEGFNLIIRTHSFVKLEGDFVIEVYDDYRE